MGIESSSTEGAPNTISRRRVVAGAAWTVPAVMVASAAPAVAASKPCVTATFGGSSCKYPGSGQNDKGYLLQICFTNDCDTEVIIDVLSIQGRAGSSPLVNVGKQITVPADGQEHCLTDLIPYCSDNSGNYIVVKYQVGGGAVQQAMLASPTQTCVGTDYCAA